MDWSREVLDNLESKGGSRSLVQEKLVVVNDCAHVMEDIIPLLSDSFQITFLKRTRGLWDKTLGIMFKILKQKGELFHVNYALQDAYLVDKLKHHLDVLHVHGSDMRLSYLSRKYHWMIKSNVLNARKILYATPDLEERTKELRPDAIYLPTPIKTDMFTPKTNYNAPLRAVHFKLSYEALPKGLEEILSNHGITLTTLERNIPYKTMPRTLANYDIFIDQTSINAYSKTCLEAMSSALATIDYRHREDFESRVKELADAADVKRIGWEGRNYVKQTHEAAKIAKVLENIYLDLHHKN